MVGAFDVVAVADVAAVAHAVVVVVVDERLETVTSFAVYGARLQKIERE